jgi:hypothetical protein
MEDLLSRRSESLKKTIFQRRPSVVIFYGLGYLEHWQKIAGTALAEDTTGMWLGKAESTVYLALKHPAGWGRMNRVYEEAGKRLRKMIV